MLFLQPIPCNKVIKSFSMNHSVQGRCSQETLTCPVKPQSFFIKDQKIQCIHLSNYYYFLENCIPWLGRHFLMWLLHCHSSMSIRGRKFLLSFGSWAVPISNWRWHSGFLWLPWRQAGCQCHYTFCYVHWISSCWPCSVVLEKL